VTACIVLGIIYSWLGKIKKKIKTNKNTSLHSKIVAREHHFSKDTNSLNR
jgi:hypothetical protein